MNNDLKAKIYEMQEKDGFYLCGDIDHPKSWVPITVKGGRIYSMLLDEIMSPDRFLDTATIAGPFDKDEKILKELESAIEVLRQTLLEVAHAQSAGPGWYTRGSDGLYQQISMWVRKGVEAIGSVDKARGKPPPEKTEPEYLVIPDFLRRNPNE